jgi:hypothetical protein
MVETIVSGIVDIITTISLVVFGIYVIRGVNNDGNSDN